MSIRKSTYGLSIAAGIAILWQSLFSGGQPEKIDRTAHK